jgi:hypothetical protein
MVSLMAPEIEPMASLNFKTEVCAKEHGPHVYRFSAGKWSQTIIA